MARQADQNNTTRPNTWKYEQPPGTATNLHKNMATGTSRTEGEGKALTSAQVERKER